MTEDYQIAWPKGASVIIQSRWRPEETHQFQTEQEAAAHAALINEAVSWIGTPFRNCTDVKGAQGGVDCAMLLVRCFVDTGRLLPFDPRPYPPQWHCHHDEERFLNLVARLGGKEVETPRIGDVCVYGFGHCYSHGAIVINKDEVVHAFQKIGMCSATRLDDTDLALRGNGERPVKFFEIRGE